MDFSDKSKRTMEKAKQNFCGTHRNRDSSSFNCRGKFRFPEQRRKEKANLVN